jgi:hypothetical protein
MEGEAPVTTAMPLGLFARTTSGEPGAASGGAAFMAEVGVVLGDGERRVAKAVYRRSQLARFALVTESKA